MAPGCARPIGDEGTSEAWLEPDDLQCGVFVALQAHGHFRTKVGLQISFCFSRISIAISEGGLSYLAAAMFVGSFKLA